jgi:hypothetical protein
LADDLSLNDKLELVYEPDLSIAGGAKESELQKE